MKKNQKKKYLLIFIVILVILLIVISKSPILNFFKKETKNIEEKCRYSDWSNWEGECGDKEEMREQIRTRKVLSGKNCDGILEEKKIIKCISKENCKTSEWEKSECPKNEKGKRTGESTTKKRKIICEGKETIEEEEELCPRDCIMSELKPEIEEEELIKKCGEIGKRDGKILNWKWKREIEKEPSFDGEKCPEPEIENREYICPLDCQIGEWDKKEEDLKCANNGPRDSYIITETSYRKIIPPNEKGYCEVDYKNPKNLEKKIEKKCEEIQSLECRYNMKITGDCQENKNIYQIQEPEIIKEGINCPSQKIEKIFCEKSKNILVNFSQNNKSIQELIDNEIDQINKWQIKKEGIILENSEISKDGKKIILSYMNNFWIKFNEKDSSKQRKQATIRNLGSEDIKLIYNVDEIIIRPNESINIDYITIGTQYLFYLEFLKERENLPITIELSNVACYKNYIDHSFMTIDNYDEEQIEKYGIKNLENTKIYCPIGKNYSSGITSKYLTYNYNDLNLENSANPTKLDKKGENSSDFFNNVKSFHTNNSCSNLAKNNSQFFEKTTGFTFNLGDLFSGSTGNIDCSVDNNNRQINAILTEMNLISQNSNNKGPYAIKYKCQPIDSDGKIQSIENYFSNLSLIYNDRSRNSCPVNSAITKITNKKDTSTNIRHFRNKNFDSSNMILIKEFFGNFDDAIIGLLNNNNANSYVLENTETPSYFKIKFFNIPKINPVQLISSNFHSSGFKWDINVISDNLPFVIPNTYYKYDCLNLS